MILQRESNFVQCRFNVPCNIFEDVNLKIRIIESISHICHALEDCKKYIFVHWNIAKYNMTVAKVTLIALKIKAKISKRYV